MEEESKELMNIRKISRMLQIPEESIGLYAKQGLTFEQMFLLCQMTLYDMPEELIYGLAERQASGSEIKQAFIGECKKDEIDQVFEFLARIEKKAGSNVGKEDLNAISSAVTKLSEMMVFRIGEVADKVEDLGKKIQKQDEEYGMADRTVDLQARRYPWPETRAWKKLQKAFPNMGAKSLKAFCRALEAGVMPRQLLPYLELEPERLEIMVYLLTAGKTEKGEVKDGK